MNRGGICFDVMGTLFDLSPLDDALREAGAPFGLEAFLGRTLHAAVALSAAGEFAPFSAVAEATLRSLLVRTGRSPDAADGVLERLGALDPYPEVPGALERVRDAGVRALAVTNGTEDNTRGLLERSGLDGLIEDVVATEHVRAYKPHRPVYERAVAALGGAAGDVTLIAAHAWDVLGARAAGLSAVWVDRVEVRWPLPVASGPSAPDVAAAVERALGPPDVRRSAP